MKISFNLLKKIINITESAEEISELITVSGLEVAMITKLVNKNSKFQGIVIGEILSIRNHPNADKLRIADVKVKENEVLQIVCGAPNLRIGQRVAVAMVGTEITNHKNEKFTIKEAKIRGEKSFGMICSEYEIGIGLEEDEIMDLEENFIVGESIEKYLELFDDTILEIEITPNRGDACSHYGVAQDLSAILNRELLNPKRTLLNNFSFSNDFSLEIQDKEDCEAFHTLLVKNIEGLKTPIGLKKFLKNIGITPKYLLVDIANFVMIYIGQPMHAYDLEKLQTKKLILRKGKGETFIGLDKKISTMSEKNLVIADGDKIACVAGVMGGSDCGISESTKIALLESAYFNPKTIRASSKSIGTSTDSSFRFERGIGNKQIEALEIFADLLREISTEVEFLNTESTKQFMPEEKKVILRLSRLNKIAGVEIEEKRALEILEKLGFSYKKNGDELALVVPFAKSDVTREIDVIEEILRIYGYNNINNEKSYTKVFLSKENHSSKKEIIKELLVGEGFFEILTLPLVSSREIGEDNIFPMENLIRLENPHSVDLDVMRPSLLYSFLKIAQYNFNREAEEVFLFEFAKEYSFYDNLPKEKNVLGILLSQKNITKSWQKSNKKLDVYDAFAIVEKLFSRCAVDSNREIINNRLGHLSINYVDKTNNSVVACLFQVSSKLLERYNMPQESFFIEIDSKFVLKDDLSVTAFPIPKFPGMFRDISVFLDYNLDFSEIQDKILSLKIDILKKIEVIDVYIEKNQTEKKSYTLRLHFLDNGKTLSSEEVKRESIKIEKILVNDMKVILR